MTNRGKRKDIIRRKSFGVFLLIICFLLNIVIFSEINNYSNIRMLSNYRTFLYNIIDKTAEILYEKYFMNESLYRRYLNNEELNLEKILSEMRQFSPLFLDIALIEKPIANPRLDYSIRVAGTELFFNFKISNQNGSLYVEDRYIQVGYDLEATLRNLQILEDFTLTTSSKSYLLIYGLRLKPKKLPLSFNQILLSLFFGILIFVLHRKISNKFHSYLYNSEGLETIIFLFEKTEEFSANHSRNVAEISHFLGKKYGLKRKKLKDLKVAAFLHDIGKISVPVNILNKSEALSKDEFGEIKKHVIYSAEIIEHFDSLKHLRDIILYHHEKLDGSGYPEGLRENQIPRESKIIAVADIFEALVGERPYRSPLDKLDALDIMKRMPLDHEILSILIFNIEEVCTLIKHKKKNQQYEYKHIFRYK